VSVYGRGEEERYRGRGMCRQKAGLYLRVLHMLLLVFALDVKLASDYVPLLYTPSNTTTPLQESC